MTGVEGIPVSIALVAGGLSVVNPCGFPLLPAFLSFYLGADEERLPRAPTRLWQGLAVGGLMSSGFLGFFAVVGLPVTYGAAAIARAVPWTGLAAGGLLALAGLVVLAGRRIALPVHPRAPLGRGRGRGPWAMVLFGVGYGAASLGCTLPIFLALVGAALGAAKVSVFLAYAAGMTLVLTALSVAVAVAREGIARRIRRLLPYAAPLSGLLLLGAGGYLAYYWARLRFGNSVTVADDPIVGPITRYSAQIQSFADGRGTAIVAAAGAVVGIALISGAWRLRRQRARATRRLLRQ
jgi:cytochrome c biogenesis protein CcdA